MDVLKFVLLLLAAVCFALAAWGWSHPRVSPIALGLLLWVLVPLITLGQRL